MEIYDISILKRDVNQTDLYDLTEPTFTTKEYPQFQMVVKKEQEMRIDLISYELYKSVDYVDFIMNINDIDNPLNIKAGDIILYDSIDKASSYRVAPNTTSEQRKSLLSPEKSNKKDPTRQKYVEDNYQMSPTLLETPGSPISSSGNNITISPTK